MAKNGIPVYPEKRNGKETGKWFFKASLGVKPNGMRATHQSGGYATKTEAKLEYNKYMSEFGSGAYSENSTMQLNHFIDEYYAVYYRAMVKGSTYEQRTYIHERIKKDLGATKLVKITERMVADWQNGLIRNEGWSNNYIRLVFGELGRVLKRAVKLGFLKINPTDAIDNVRKVVPEVDFWTLDEVRRVLKTYNRSDYSETLNYVTVKLLFMTGMRVSEALALDWKSVDFKRGQINISKTLVYKNKADYHTTRPKTKSSMRIINIDDDTMNTLQMWKNLQEIYVGSSTFVLSADGDPLHRDYVRRQIRRHAQLANVKTIRVHDLRHSHVAMLIDKGFNILMVSRRIGHKDVATTLSVYGHLYPNADQQITDELKNILQLEPSAGTDMPLPTSNQYITHERVVLDGNRVEEEVRSYVIAGAA